MQKTTCVCVLFFFSLVSCRLCGASGVRQKIKTGKNKCGIIYACTRCDDIRSLCIRSLGFFVGSCSPVIRIDYPFPFIFPQTLRTYQLYIHKRDAIKNEMKSNRNGRRAKANKNARSTILASDKTGKWPNLKHSLISFRCGSNCPLRHNIYSSFIDLLCVAMKIENAHLPVRKFCRVQH